jgi:glycine/D-amino acid oxidase-like deaminating enzyme
VKLSGATLLASLLPAARRSAAARRPGSRPRVAVVGAGIFGGFTALTLLDRGADVVLLDAWGPGNSRASSGGETRVIRGVYGADRTYTQMAARAFELWTKLEKRSGLRFYHPTGALWMAREGSGDFVASSLPVLSEFGFPYERLTVVEAARRYPQISFTGVEWALFEKRAGYLLARRSCEAVLEEFRRGKGDYRPLRAVPGPIRSGKLEGLSLSDGVSLSADAYVFACGPWLGSLFPDVIGNRIQPTRQEVFYFGTPSGDAGFSEGRMPVWVDVGPRLVYGIPGNEWRGFKLADDTRGEPFDPTSGDRMVSASGLAEARSFLAMRFPALRDAPLLESRVCQYENTPDHDFILDRHPGAENAWILGGGSGHGFKHGPAVGERMARLVLGESSVEPKFALARLNKKEAG